MTELQKTFAFGKSAKDFAYPNKPGYKDNDTGLDAAISMDKAAPALRGECLAAIKKHGPLTADETAEILGRDKLSIRPRFTELLFVKSIVDTGERRKNSSGRNAKVWGLA